MQIKKKTNSINGCSSYHVKTNQQWWYDKLTAKSIKIYELDKPRECSPSQIRRSMVRRRRRLLGFRGGKGGKKGFWSIGFCPGRHYLMSKPNQTVNYKSNVRKKITFENKHGLVFFFSPPYIRASHELVHLSFYFEKFSKSHCWKNTQIKNNNKDNYEVSTQSNTFNSFPFNYQNNYKKIILKYLWICTFFKNFNISHNNAKKIKFYQLYINILYF